MNIVSIGDSHADFSFRGIIPDGLRLNMGAWTMHRVRRDRINLVKNAWHNTKREDMDAVISCVGEVDIRCHLHDRGGIEEMVREYAEVLMVQRESEQLRVVAMCPVPPRRYQKDIENPTLPVRGSDEDRLGYHYLVCNYLKIYYNDVLDVCHYYADMDGYLRDDLSDHNVHIGDTQYVKKAMEGMGL